jgi:hypothetical protein
MGSTKQPLFFTACSLSKYDDFIQCRFSVDISHGYRLTIKFTNNNFVRNFEDGSELYNCTIEGPENLEDYCTGDVVENGHELLIPLYHHTNKKSHDLILQSKYFKSSPWNFQGSNEKVLENVHYTYFTCLDSITTQDDLAQIAMASSGKLILLKDNGSANNPNDLVILDVYRENTINRTHPIKKLIPVSLLASNHLIKHFPMGEPVYFQVVNQFIYRVGLHPNQFLPFNGQIITPNKDALKRFEYIVIGDGRTREGLIAPYDEENTPHILKIQAVDNGSNILNFWFDEGNQDLFTNRQVEVQSFQSIKT